MASIPSLDSERKAPLSTIEGTVPGLHELPTGCRFHPRCSHAGAPCRETAPQLLEVETGHRAACHWTAGALES